MMQQGQYTDEQIDAMNSVDELRLTAKQLLAELATMHSVQDAASGGVLLSKTPTSTPLQVPPFNPPFPPQLSPTSYSTAAHSSPFPSPPPTTTTAHALALRVQGLRTSDYQNAKLSFEVVLERFGTTPGKAAATLPPNSDWHVVICAENGHRQIDTAILDSADRQVPLSADGVARVTELQFLKLSSKNGNHFRLNFSLKGTGAPAVCTKSEKITIKCARMRCDAKISHADLRPDDLIAKMPEIGRGYADKFEKKLGLVTVSDLAKIDLSASARPLRLELLSKVRNTRGSLTIDKLEGHIRAAKATVRRASGIPEPEPEPEPEVALARLGQAHAEPAAVLPPCQPSAPSAAVTMAVVAEDLSDNGLFSTPMAMGTTCEAVFTSSHVSSHISSSHISSSHSHSHSHSHSSSNHSHSSSSHSHSHSSSSSSSKDSSTIHGEEGTFDSKFFDMVNADMINSDYFLDSDVAYPSAPWTLTGDDAINAAPTGSLHPLLG